MTDLGRSIRGGSWNNDVSNAESGNRNNANAGNRNSNMGFGLVNTNLREIDAVYGLHLSALGFVQAIIPVLVLNWTRRISKGPQRLVAQAKTVAAYWPFSFPFDQTLEYRNQNADQGYYTVF